MANDPLQLPVSVRKAAELAAEFDGVSLNQFFATAIAEKAAMLTAARVLDERSAPREGDEIPPSPDGTPLARPS